MQFTSIIAAFVSGLAMVQAAPAVEARQVAASCPKGAPNRMSSDASNFWSNICCAYNVDQVRLSPSFMVMDLKETRR